MAGVRQLGWKAIPAVRSGYGADTLPDRYHSTGRCRSARTTVHHARRRDRYRRTRRFSLPRLDITGMWVFSLGVWFHIVARLVYSKPWMAFFLAELIAAILVLFGAYQVLDAWIARVSLEEREALEARQQAMMEGQQEGGHVSH